MLESMRLKNVGPSSEMNMSFAPRLNLITGDNGLGKSFLLDVAWWVLTRTWARYPVIPDSPSTKPEIDYGYTKSTSGSYTYKSTFNRATGAWSVKNSRPAIPGLVLYAQVDGGFSVWDPARNYWKADAPERPSAFLFAPHEVWEGNAYCEGLIRDWASWQRENGETFDTFRKVLKVLSPSPMEELVAGDLRKITVDDPKRYPTLRMPYGEDVAVIHASAGMRRIIALTYLLVWAWQEHLAAASLRGDSPAREIIFLIDEIEAHLHPQWQRRIAPAILEVMKALSGHKSTRIQLVAVTHSPLVLASAEPVFDWEKDAWFDLDLKEKKVVLCRRDFIRRGEVGNWLTSEAFDLKSARSLAAEAAIEEALAVLREVNPESKAVESADLALRKAGLPDIDPFWVRWGKFVEDFRAAKRGKR